ncbi:MAG: hypothetical protein ABRQ37_18730 [Candidatus Eremiobacterota bacterium]
MNELITDINLTASPIEETPITIKGRNYAWRRGKYVTISDPYFIESLKRQHPLWGKVLCKNCKHSSIYLGQKNIYCHETLYLMSGREHYFNCDYYIQKTNAKIIEHLPYRPLYLRDLLELLTIPVLHHYPKNEPGVSVFCKDCLYIEWHADEANYSKCLINGTLSYLNTPQNCEKFILRNRYKWPGI